MASRNASFVVPANVAPDGPPRGISAEREAHAGFQTQLPKDKARATTLCDGNEIRIWKRFTFSKINSIKF